MKHWSRPEFDSTDIKKTAYGNPVNGIGDGKKIAASVNNLGAEGEIVIGDIVNVMSGELGTL